MPLLLRMLFVSVLFISTLVFGFVLGRRRLIRCPRTFSSSSEVVVVLFVALVRSRRRPKSPSSYSLPSYVLVVVLFVALVRSRRRFDHLYDGAYARLQSICDYYKSLGMESECNVFTRLNAPAFIKF